MVWFDFDWLKYESEQFQESLNHRISEAYLAAYRVTNWRAPLLPPFEKAPRYSSQ
jgi:hypothetical protein